MAHIDEQYRKLAQTVLVLGESYNDETRGGVSMLEIPSYDLEIDMAAGFPLLTTKKIFWKTAVHELIWMLSGSTNIRYLQRNGIKIWDQDALDFSGGAYVGRIYGAQWRKWAGGLDQIKNLIDELKAGSLYKRRNLVVAWNPAEVGENDVALPPCHWGFQIMPCPGGFALKWFQRSTDAFLGLPFDIALYALLGKVIQRLTGIKFRTLIGSLSCVHLYGPHIELAKEQIGRVPMPNQAWIGLRDLSGIDDLTADHFTLGSYKSHPPIKAKLITKSYKS